MTAMSVSEAGARRLKVPPPCSARVLDPGPPSIWSPALKVPAEARIVFEGNRPLIVSARVVRLKVWPGTFVTVRSVPPLSSDTSAKRAPL